MPTLSRQHQLKDDIIYHIFNRGNRKLKIFHEDGDYLHFKDIIRRYVSKKELIIAHYSLMPNHYHLEAGMEKPEAMSSIIGGINRAYTHYYHKKYKTSGYLWQGRFKSKPVEKEEYSIRLGGYIEMNPVRAGLVKSPEEYVYSSARHYILGEPDDLVTEDPNFQDFGITTEEKRKKYLKHLMENYQDTQNEKALLQEVVGSKGFKNRLCKNSGRWVPKRQGKPIIRL